MASREPEKLKLQTSHLDLVQIYLNTKNICVMKHKQSQIASSGGSLLYNGLQRVPGKASVVHIS